MQISMYVSKAAAVCAWVVDWYVQAEVGIVASLSAVDDLLCGIFTATFQPWNLPYSTDGFCSW